MTKYSVFTVTDSRDDHGIVTARLGQFSTKIKAMQAAKKAARTHGDCVPYGPTSIAYVGADMTSVVSW